MKAFVSSIVAGTRALVYGGAALALDALVPRGGYSVHKNIPYGEGARHRLDLYVPQSLAAPAPVLIFFHGGSWQFGDKDQYRAFGQAFASRGIVTVVANYRLYPPEGFPSFIEDGAAAFRHMQERAAEFGGDARRIFISGHSAGAYIAAMLAANGSYLRAVGADPSAPRGIIGIAGPYDFLPLKDPALIDLFGGDSVMETQPVHLIDGKRPPMFLAHGGSDKTVFPGNSKRLAKKLWSVGSDAEVKFYPGVGHIGILLSLVSGFRRRTTLYQDMLAFIANH